jgi:hypothetical protein
MFKKRAKKRTFTSMSEQVNDEKSDSGEFVAPVAIKRQKVVGVGQSTKVQAEQTRGFISKEVGTL